MSRVAIIGAGGYVGSTNMVVLAKENEIHAVEVDKYKHDRMLWAGELVTEDNLAKELFSRYYDNIQFYNHLIDLSPDIELDYAVVCVPTNSTEDGSLDMSILDSVVKYLVSKWPNIIVIIRSTVNPGSLEDYPDNVVFMPEFLREGSAVHDELHPDRVVIGGGISAVDAVQNLYADTDIDSHTIYNKCYKLSRAEAELVKIASNTYLAYRLSYFNMIHQLTKHLGIEDDTQLLDAIRADHRIGSIYSTPSLGFGGPCLPKDSLALSTLVDKYLPSMNIIKDLNDFNDHVLISDYHRILDRYNQGNYSNPVFLGLGFKNGSSDLRSSRYYQLAKLLKDAIPNLKFYDKEAGYNLSDGEINAADFFIMGSNDQGLIVDTPWI